MRVETQQYGVITFSYWGFTLTDGALRMLVILYFHQLGFSPFEVASVFILYELCGVFTNLMGGWLASIMGLNTAMQLGLLLQITALGLLFIIDTSELTVVYVMFTQALSGMGKDLNKMSAKSSIKLLVPHNEQAKLYQWVALLTGSKNTLKGVGFFMGAFLLEYQGFQGALGSMLIGLLIMLLLNMLFLQKGKGKIRHKVTLTQLFSQSSAVNYLSAARLFLFAARDIWFVIALPVFLQAQFQWSHTEVGLLLAVWVIVYGLLQSSAPLITGIRQGKIPDGYHALYWSVILAFVMALISLLMSIMPPIQWLLILGLFIFAAVFAVNSAVHSYLIVAYAKADGVAIEVGFYYMANALGRLVGTLLSGFLYQSIGFIGCLWTTVVFILITSCISLGLPRNKAVFRR